MKPYFERDGIALYNADCLEHTGLWTCADVLVSDPPYGVAWSQRANNARKGYESRAHAGIRNDEDTSARDAVLGLFLGPWIVFGSFYAPEPEDTRQVLVWPKPAGSGVVGSTTGWRRDCEPVFLGGEWPRRPCEWSSVLPTGASNIASLIAPTGHPHTKPVPLMRCLVEKCPQGVVVDPFAGSGSTLVACAELGRRAIGFEIEERYCEIAVRRIDNALDQGSLFDRSEVVA